MKKSSYKNPVLLLGLFDTAIMTARCFCNEGIAVYGMDHDITLNGFFSNTIESIQCPNPTESEGEWLNFVVNWIKSKETLSFVLIPTSDKYVHLISKFRNHFENIAKFILPDYSVIDNLLDRKRQFDLAAENGIDVPKIYGDHTTKLDSLLDNITLPLAIKPLNINSWKEKFTNKGFLIHELEDFKKTYELVKSKNVDFLIQEVIEGPNTCNFEVNTLLLPSGEYFQHSIQKLRQYPDRFGTATSIKVLKNSEIEKSALNLLNSIKLLGFSNLEFKYCEKKSKFYYIETNPRVWLQVNFSKKIGLNFPMIYYNFLIKNEIPVSNFEIKKSGVWVDFFPDILYWVRYRKIHKIGLFAFLKSWFPLKSTGVFSLRDRKPFFRELNNIINKK
jgi:predicted ATP-grasp superfamily ATP-dependent carboligase